MPNSSNADFQLVVGADIPVSTEQLKKDIKTILDNLSSDTLKVKLGFEFSDDDAKKFSKDIVDSVNNKLSDKKIDLSDALDVTRSSKSLGNADKALQSISKDLGEILHFVELINAKSFQINLGKGAEKAKVDISYYKNAAKAYADYIKEMNSASASLAEKTSAGQSRTRDSYAKSFNAIVQSTSFKNVNAFSEFSGKAAKQIEKTIQMLGDPSLTPSAIGKQIQLLANLKESYDELFAAAKKAGVEMQLPETTNIDAAVGALDRQKEIIKQENAAMREAVKNLPSGAGADFLSSLIKTSADGSQIVAQNVTVMSQQTASAMEDVGNHAERLSSRVDKSFQHVTQQTTSTGEEVRRALGDMELAMSEIDDGMRKSIEASLIKSNVKQDDIQKLLPEFKDMSGTITAITAQYDTFGSQVENRFEHISKVVIDATDGMGSSFRKIVRWNPIYDDEGNLEYDSFDKVSSGIAKYTLATQDAGAATQNLKVNITDAVSEIDSYLKTLDTAISRGETAGLTENDKAQADLINLRDQYRSLKEEVYKNTLYQKDYDAVVSNSSANIGSLVNAQNLSMQALRNETAAKKEALSLDKARYEVNREIQRVAAQELAGRQNGVLTDSDSYQKLEAYQNALQGLHDEIGVSIKSYDEYLAKFIAIKNEFVDAENLVKADTASIKENALAKKEAAEVDKARLQIAQEVERLSERDTALRRSGVSADSDAYQRFAEYKNAIEGLQSELNSGGIKLEDYRQKLVGIKTEYADVGRLTKEEVTNVKESEAARAEYIRVLETQAKILKEANASEKLVGRAQDVAGMLGKEVDVGAVRDYITALYDLFDSTDPAVASQKELDASFRALTAGISGAKLILADHTAELENEIKVAKEAAKAEAARVNQAQARGAIASERGRVSGIINGATGIGLSDQDASLQSLVTYTNLLDILESELQSANLTQKEFNTIMGNLKSIFKEPEIAVKDLTKELKVQESHIAKSAKTYQEIERACIDYEKAAESSNDDVRNTYMEMQKLGFSIDDAAAKLRRNEITTEQYDAVVKGTSASLQQYIKALNEAGYGAGNASSKFAQLTQQLTRFITPLYLARKAWQTIKNMANVVIELEDAFAQLQIVTGATDKELEEFYDTATKISATLGKSITDIAASIEVFSRLGYSLPDATTLAQYATVLSNVASVSTDEATTGLTSIIKGYNMHVEQAAHVSDVLVDIGQKYAVSAGEMMEAYERAGAALAATNTSFDKSAALIAAANAAIQNSSTVGTALKTISARIRGSKSDLEELGEDTTELADGFSKYAKELKAITGVNIMVEGTTNQFKDLYDIMDGVAGVWDKLTDTQQARAAEILGGTRQLQVIASIISNWGDAERALVTAQESAGAAARANSIYMDTTTAHTNQFKAAFQDLSHTVIDSDMLKSIVDLGTGLLNVINAVGKFINSLGGIVPVLNAIAAAVLLLKPMLLPSIIGKVGVAITGLFASITTGATTAGMAVSTLSGGLGLLLGTVAIVGAAVHKVRAEQEKEREATIKAGQAYAAEEEELLSLVDKYEELERSGAAHEEIMSARDAVIDKLREEGQEVAELSDRYRDYTKEVRNSVIEKLKADNYDRGNSIEAAQEDLDTKNYGNYRDVRTIEWDRSDSQKNQDALRSIREYLQLSKTGNKGDRAQIQLDVEAGNALDAFNKVEAAMKKLQEDGNTTNAVYRELSRMYDELSVGVDTYNGLLTDQLNTTAAIQMLSTDSPKTIDDYVRMRESIIGLISGQEEFKDTTIDVTAAVDNFLAKQTDFESFNAALSNVSEDAKAEYDSLLKEVSDKNIDITKTVFGNIDMDHRKAIEWTNATISKYIHELESWGEDVNSIRDSLGGTMSTVYGRTEQFDGIEIAFSPILQTENGAVLLSSDTVYSYISRLLDQVRASGESWSTEDLLKLDSEGLVIEGQRIKNIIADVGETAIQTGEAMHYVGEGGALAMAREQLYQLAYQAYAAANSANALQQAYSGFSEVKSAFDGVTTSLKAITDMQDLVAKGFDVDVEKAMALAEAYPQILDNATVSADGQLLLNEATVNSFLESKQAEINASIDAKIADLEADKATLEAKRDFAVAQLEMAQQVANGENQLTVEQLQNRLNNQNQVVQALIGMGFDESEAYKAVLTAMNENTEAFDGNVADTAENIAANMASASSSMATGFNANVRAMNTGMKILVGNAHQVATAVEAMGRGEVSGAIGYTDGGGDGQTINTFGKQLSKKSLISANVKYRSRNVQLNNIIKQLNTDISGYTSAINAINGQISTLNAIRNKAISDIANYKPGTSSGSGGSGGGGGGGGGGGSGSSSNEETWFQKQYKLHQHYVNMDKETQADFLKWLDKAYKQAYKEGIITLDEFYKYEEEVYKGFNQIKENAKSTFEALVDYRLKMLQKERENQKEELQNQLNDLKDFYDKQRDMLQKSQEEQKYLNEQAEKRQSVTDLKTEIARLQFDTSAWATKRRIELQQQLSDAEKDLQDFEDEHALAEALDALDSAYKAEEERINKEMEAIDEVLNDPDALYNQALKDIKGNTEDLFKAFLLFNKKYGDGKDDTVKSLWEEAFKNSEAYKKIFGSYYEDTKIGNYTGYKAPTTNSSSSSTKSGSSSSGSSKSSGSSSSNKSSGTPANGSTVQVKTSATNFSPKSGSVRMASFVPGGQYTVYQTSGNEVLIGRGGVYTGWVYKSDLVGYKKGTKNAKPGLHRVNEEGAEAIFSSSDGNKYRMFSGGEKVLNARATSFLYEFATAGAEILDKMKGSVSDSFSHIGTFNQPITISMGDIVIEGDTNQQTVSEIRRAQREQINDVLKSFKSYQVTLYRGVKY